MNKQARCAAIASLVLHQSFPSYSALPFRLFGRYTDPKMHPLPGSRVFADEEEAVAPSLG
jgi:hypothetical protein